MTIEFSNNGLEVSTSGVGRHGGISLSPDRSEPISPLVNSSFDSAGFSTAQRILLQLVGDDPRRFISPQEAKRLRRSGLQGGITESFHQLIMALEESYTANRMMPHPSVKGIRQSISAIDLLAEHEKLYLRIPLKLCSIRFGSRAIAISSDLAKELSDGQLTTRFGRQVGKSSDHLRVGVFTHRIEILFSELIKAGVPYSTRYRDAVAVFLAEIQSLQK